MLQMVMMEKISTMLFPEMYFQSQTYVQHHVHGPGSLKPDHSADEQAVETNMSIEYLR